MPIILKSLRRHDRPGLPTNNADFDVEVSSSSAPINSGQTDWKIKSVQECVVDSINEVDTDDCELIGNYEGKNNEDELVCSSDTIWNLEDDRAFSTGKLHQWRWPEIFSFS